MPDHSFPAVLELLAADKVVELLGKRLIFTTLVLRLHDSADDASLPVAYMRAGNTDGSGQKSDGEFFPCLRVDENPFGTVNHAEHPVRDRMDGVFVILPVIEGSKVFRPDRFCTFGEDFL